VPVCGTDRQTTDRSPQNTRSAARKIWIEDDSEEERQDEPCKDNGQRTTREAKKLWLLLLLLRRPTYIHIIYYGRFFHCCRRHYGCRRRSAYFGCFFSVCIGAASGDQNGIVGSMWQFPSTLGHPRRAGSKVLSQSILEVS